MHNVKNLKELAILELGEVRPSLWSILIDLPSTKQNKANTHVS